MNRTQLGSKYMRLFNSYSMISCRSMSTYPAHTIVGMPALSPTMTSGTIGQWHCKVGDAIKPGETFAEVETDKASMAFEAQEEGFIAKLLVESGVEVTVGAPILITVEDSSFVAAFANYTSPSSPVVVAANPTNPATVTAIQTPTIEPVKSSTPTPFIPNLQSSPVVSPTPVVKPETLKVEQPIIEKKLTTVPKVESTSSKQSSTTMPVYLWGAGITKSVLALKLSKEQAAYNLKYGRSLHKPIVVPGSK